MNRPPHDNPNQETRPCELPRQPSYHPLVLVLVAVVLGILADRWFSLPLAAWWSMALLGGVTWLWLYLCKKARRAGLVLLFAVASVAGSWHQLHWSRFEADNLSRFATYEPRPVCLEAIVLETPNVHPVTKRDPLRLIPEYDRTRFSVRAVALRDRADWIPASGRAAVSVSGHLLDVKPGDRIRIFGKLSRPSPPRNPAEPSWDKILRLRRTLAQVRVAYPDCVTVIDRGTWWNPRRRIASMRAEALSILKTHLDSDHVALASAMLLGAREELEHETIDAFQRTGSIHFLVISGLHVGMLVWFFLIVMRGLPVSPRTAALLAGTIAIGFTILTGNRPPAIRATILVLVFCGSWFFHRPPRPFNSLAAAGLVVLAINPAELFRVGTQLSFLAVAALIQWEPVWLSVQRKLVTASETELPEVLWDRPWYFSWAKNVGRSAWGLFRVSLVVWLTIMPLTMARFHLFSPIGVPLNTLLWLPTALALASGFLVLLFGAVFPPLAVLAALVCDTNLGLLQKGIDVGQQIPGAYCWVPGPSDWWLIGFYLLGLAVIVPFRFRPPTRWAVAILAAWISVGLAASLYPNRSGRWEADFLSVGHGGATVIHFPSGKTLLYDCGAFSSPERAAQITAGALWQKGITHLDAIVVSHPDADHFNGLPGILERFSVGIIYAPPSMFDRVDQSPALRALRKAIRNADVPLAWLTCGDRLDVGADAIVEVLHPTADFATQTDNSNATSIVLQITCHERRFLLTGDLEPPGLQSALKRATLPCELLLIPHHGSKQSDPNGLAQKACPRWALISGSPNRPATDVETIYRNEGAQVLHTGRDGAVEVLVDENEMTVSPFIDVCTANEPRPTNGRPEKGPNRFDRPGHFQSKHQ